MRTTELLPLALLAGAAVATHGCHLRGDSKANARHNNNADLNSIENFAKVKKDLPVLLAAPAGGGRGGRGRVAGGFRHRYDSAAVKVEETTRKDLRAAKIESRDEVLRHREAAKMLKEKCADEMSKWGCQIGFKPAGCLRNHPASDVCTEALVSWYQGEPKAPIDKELEMGVMPEGVAMLKMHARVEREQLRLEREFVGDQAMKRVVEVGPLTKELAIPGDARGPHGPHDLHGPHHDRPRGGGRPEPHGPHVRSPHHQHPHPRHGGDRESVDLIIRDRPPRSTFTVLMDWINGVDSSESSDSSNSDSSDSNEPSSDSSDSGDSDDSSEDDGWHRRPRSERRNRGGDAHHPHHDNHHRMHGPSSGGEPGKKLHHKTEPDNIARWSHQLHDGDVVEVSMFGDDPESTVFWKDEALFHGGPLDADGEDRVIFEDTPRHGPHGHGPHGHAPGYHRGGGHRFHENSQHDHLRYRNRLPDDFDHSSWHDSFEGDFEDCDFVEGMLAFFFLVGALTLLLMPFVMFARALKRMARSSRSSSTSTPPGPSSSAFGGFARRRESNAAAAAAAAAGYQALPEEPAAAAAAAAAVEDDEDDDDAIVVTGTPVNPPPSVNI